MFSSMGSNVKLNEQDKSELAQIVTDAINTQMGNDISEIHNSLEIINQMNEDVSYLKDISNNTFLIENYPNLVDLESAEWLDDKVLNNLGWTEDRAGYTTLKYPIPVEPGKIYSFSKIVDKVVIKSNSTIADYMGGFIGFKSGTGYKYTVPETYTNGKYMFLSFHSASKDYEQFHDIKVEEGDVIHNVDREINLSENIVIPNFIKSNLYGKKIMTLGDSLTAGGHWQKYVSDMLCLASVTDLAVGGTKVNVFADAVTAENIADIDIVTVMGLFNSTDSVPGTVNDEASNDPKASICAGYKYIIDKLLTLKPSVKIVLMSPHRPRANDVSEKAAAVGEVAKYYGLPFIDLYNTAGFNEYTYDIYLYDDVHSTIGDSGGYAKEAQVIAGGLVHYFG